MGRLWALEDGAAFWTERRILILLPFTYLKLYSEIAHLSSNGAPAGAHLSVYSHRDYRKVPFENALEPVYDQPRNSRNALKSIGFAEEQESNQTLLNND